MVSDNVILWPREQDRYSGTTEVNRFLDGHKIRPISTFPDFIIPDNPTWTEDPFHSRSWSLYYQSLGWLYEAEETYKRGLFPEFPTFLKTMVLDFLKANDDIEHPTHPMVWASAVTAYRTANLTYFYQNYFREGEGSLGIPLSDSEKTVFAHGMLNHVEMDLSLLSQAVRFEDNNHRIFHSMALATFASVFGRAVGTPFADANSQQHLTQALTTLDATISNIIDFSTGITKEQSSLYHRVDMSLVLEIKQLVVDQGYDLPHDLNALLKKMLEFDVLSRDPSNSIPDIGDTAYETQPDPSTINHLIGLGLVSPFTKYVLTQGADGIRPPDLIDYSIGGYIIFRPEYSWENARDTRVLIDVSPKLSSHGHYDNTNVTFSSYGKNILIDSGGPYSYDDTPEMGLSGPFREAYFIQSVAHNVVVVDGKSFDADTEILGTADKATYSYVSAHHSGYVNIDMSRDVLFMKEAGILLVLDNADNSAAAVHDYTLNYHFAPEATGANPASYMTFNVGPVYVDAAFSTSGSVSYNVISGRLGNNPQGWVSPGPYLAEKAPVLEIKQAGVTDAWFASAFATSLSAAQQLFFETEKTDSGYEAWVSVDGSRWHIVVNDHHISEFTKTLTPVGAANIMDSNSATIINGDSSESWLAGRGGNDTINGGSGNELILGGGGHDSLIAGDGNDSVFGGAGFDTIFGGSGNDTLSGGDNSDSLNGGDGGDRILGGLSNDTVLGGLGKDTIYGGNGLDSLVGGDDNDTIYGEAHDDILIGGAGHDLLDGGVANDELHGNIGLDTLLGGTGNDSLYGEDSADRLSGDFGNDLLDGGIGNDTLLGGNGQDVLYGGSGNDSLDGGEHNDALFGDTGADILLGGNGNDSLTGGDAADLLTGGAGRDAFMYAAPKDSAPAAFDTITDFSHADHDVINLQAFSGVFTFIGTAGFTAAHQVRYQVGADTTTITADFNSDKVADFKLVLDGAHTLTAADFIL